MKKQSKQPISKIQRDIWNECRRIKDRPIVDCYTCGAKDLQGSNKQLGHMWSKATLSACLKYELDILEWQCSRSNTLFEFRFYYKLAFTCKHLLC